MKFWSKLKKLFIYENASENIDCEKPAILSFNHLVSVSGCDRITATHMAEVLIMKHIRTKAMCTWGDWSGIHCVAQNSDAYYLLNDWCIHTAISVQASNTTYLIKQSLEYIPNETETSKNGHHWGILIDSKVHRANMGPTWVLSVLDWTHVGPMNRAIRVRS